MLHIISRIDKLEQAVMYATATDRFLLVEDAVYAANPRHHAFLSIQPLQTLVLRPDAEARGIIDMLESSIAVIDFSGFVDLTAEHSKSITW
ncbi:sulfurtransferase complex subunit TusB [Vibrio gallicus]|uniref:sulfurtransferase complex subunit TusB n=1 Tax=Vibrio gallicus TaxID=190897 RepID=UPI0021C293C3|nr:sulfurtransferase complex subunit TusB [Vibrio gallicus]